MRKPFSLFKAYFCGKIYLLNYFQLSIYISNNETRELLIAALSEQGIEGFEESEQMLKAFVSENDYQPDIVSKTLQEFGLDFEVETIAPTNWNAQWEADFEPVVVGDFCTMRAHFHIVDANTKYDLLITPKMSFGTGHHATTRLMVEQMQYLNFESKKVLDFGTGTGILAILADKLGAASTMAIDNDEWSYENAQENVKLNCCKKVTVSMDALDNFNVSQPFDIILANINRHILLQYMDAMFELLVPNGTLLMSGLLIEDESIISQSAIGAGFNIQRVNTIGQWISILCHKS